MNASEFKKIYRRPVFSIDCVICSNVQLECVTERVKVQYHFKVYYDMKVLPLFFMSSTIGGATTYTIGGAHNSVHHLWVVYLR